MQTAAQIAPPQWLASVFDALPAQPEAPTDAEGHYREAVRHKLSGTAHVAAAGWHLKCVHALEGRAFLLSKAQEARLSIRTLYNYIDAFDVLQRAADVGGEELLQTLLGADHSKVIRLKVLDDRELGRLAQGEEARGITIDMFDTLSAREIETRLRDTDEFAKMNKRIQRLENQNKDLQAERDAHRERANSLQTKNYGAESSYPYPDFVAVARRESNKLTEKAQLCIDDLRQLTTDHAELKSTITDDRVLEFWHTGAAAIYYNAKALAAQAVDLIEMVEQAVPDVVSAEFKADYLYNEADIEQAVRDREVLVQMHEHERVSKELNGKRKKRSKK